MLCHLHVSRVAEHGPAVGVGVPGLLVDLEGAGGGDHLDPARDLAQCGDY